eukprot:459896-Prymnesium_polylepis.1
MLIGSPYSLRQAGRKLLASTRPIRARANQARVRARGRGHPKPQEAMKKTIGSVGSRTIETHTHSLLALASAFKDDDDAPDHIFSMPSKS